MTEVINSRNNLSKKDIVKNISFNIGIPSSLSIKIVNDIIDILIQNLKIIKIIKIKNFGVFLLRKKKERKGINPKNKKTYNISERLVITFKPSDYLKIRVNKNVK